MLVIAIDGHKIEINHYWDLTDAITRLPELSALELIQRFMADVEGFKQVINNCYQLRNALESIAENYQKIIIEDIINDDVKFYFIFKNYYTLLHIVTQLPHIYVKSIIDKLLTNPKLFAKIVNFHDLLYLIDKIPRIYAKPILEYFYHVNGKTALHFVIKAAPQYVLPLLQQGDNPNFENAEGRDVLYTLRDQKKGFNYSHALALIEYGANPNGMFHHLTFLHNASFHRVNGYIPRLLEYGADPTIKTPKGENALDIFMNPSKAFSDSDEKFAVLLLQYGAISHVKNANGENILQILYRYYPAIKNYVSSKGIPKNELENTNYVFNHLDMCLFRLEIKCQSPIHQARNNFLTFCYYLATNNNEEPLFSKLPLEIILYIFSFLGLNKTENEYGLLLHTILQQHDVIRQMASAPGGISVLQQKDVETGNLKFTFFKSAPIICLDYANLKEQLKHNQTHAHPTWDKMTGKKFTHTSHTKLQGFKENYAIGWVRHSSLYQRPALRQALFNDIKNSGLYIQNEYQDRLKK